MAREAPNRSGTSWALRRFHFPRPAPPRRWFRATEDQIGLAIAVEVGNRERRISGTGEERLFRLEGPIAVAEEARDPATARDDGIQFVVAVQVGNCDRADVQGRRDPVSDRRLKAGAAVADQNLQGRAVREGRAREDIRNSVAVYIGHRQGFDDEHRYCASEVIFSAASNTGHTSAKYAPGGPVASLLLTHRYPPEFRRVNTSGGWKRQRASDRKTRAAGELLLEIARGTNDAVREASVISNAV